jgi:DNA polymerase III subunit epsilon
VDFVAVDVETANASLASICQVGLASFSAGRLVEEFWSLIDPEDFFDYPNICVHGIRPEDVVGAPVLPEFADLISSRLDGNVAVCHTHFDRVAVHQAWKKYGLPAPDCAWLDSACVARRTWSEFASCGYGLQSVCDHIRYKYRAHDALEDAKAAGHVLLAAIRKSGLSVEDWLVRARQPIDPSGRRVSRQGNPLGPLFGEVMIFTGTLTIPRREAADMADTVGCEVGDSVTKKTTMLVVGDQDVAKLAGHEKSSKHRKAEELIAQGQALRILRESDFLEIVALEVERRRS